MTTWLVYLGVLVGGAVGAPCRYLIDRAVSTRWVSDFPWGTFVINLSGSLVLGLLTGLTLHGHLAPPVQALLATGFCGAYTTFSTFTYETVHLLEEGELLRAGANVAASLLVGLAAAGAGVAAGLAL